MSATYDFIPLSVPTFIKDMVNKVSENLKYSLNDSIAGLPVNYKHGSWMEIERQLIEDSDMKSKRNYRYPCVLLVHPITEKMAKARNASNVTCDIIIVTDSLSTNTVDVREENSFKKILYPIYAELLKQIKDSPLCMEYSTLNHTKKDLYHLGQESAAGNMKYKLPDAMDGVALLNLEFDLKHLEIGTDDICNDTECSSGREVDFINYIKDVSTRVEGRTIYVILNDAYYYDSSGASEALYELYDPETDNSFALNIGTPYLFNTTGLSAGSYKLQVRCRDAYVELLFQISGGAIIRYTKRIIQNFPLNYDCSLYPNYTAVMDYSHEAEDITFVVKDVENNGVVIINEDINVYEQLHVVQSLTIDNTLRNMFLYIDSAQGFSNNNSIIKLKCK